MLPELTEIKEKRKKLELSQSQLAKKAGISQSLVAKIESGKVAPSYGNAKKIFDFFESTKKHKTIAAKDIMTQKVVVCRADWPASKAIRLMKKHGISQLPVIDGEKIVGTISEKEIIDKIAKEKDTANFGQKKASELMKDIMPQVNQETPLYIISSLLEANQSVLVAKNGRILGIVSRTDLLEPFAKEGLRHKR